MNLSDYNRYWKEFLQSEKCPPVLGLAPLSEQDSEKIHALVQIELSIDSTQRYVKLLTLLKIYPAVMTVWLARITGEAYDEGSFWEKFSSRIGVELNTSDRPTFVHAFRKSCLLAGMTRIDPPHLGTFKHMERMLFQAGLPLCHVDQFAKSMRWVERHYSLPDPRAPDAGQDLRAMMRRSPYLANIPILQRALGSLAGPLICEIALSVALETEPLEINPTLARAIEDSFKDIGHKTAERPRSPFLRLAADFCSLEVVCPNQPASLVGPTGLLWVVGGTPQRVGANDETSFPVSSQEQVTVELRGLAGGHNLRREFDLRWAELKQPFLVFDGNSRCWRRVEDGETIGLRSGQYWVLHSAEAQFDESTSRCDWPDGKSALSQINLRPGQQLALTANEANFVFKTVQAPFFAPKGHSFRTDALERIHFGWSSLPDIWCPFEGDAVSSPEWRLHIHTGNQKWLVTLANGERIGNMLRYQCDDRGYFKALAPGLHFIELALSRGEGKPQCKETFKLWVGLREHREGVSFDCDALPSNIRWEECLGLPRDGNALKHSNDNRRQHILAFDVDKEIVTFRFSRSGTFLESFEKRAGHAIHTEACRLEDSFSASIHSARFLRVWHIPACDYDIVVNGKIVQAVARTSGCLFTDLSLGNLSSQFSSGGEITLKLPGYLIKVAKFTKPLVPRFADTQSNDNYESLVFKFADEVSWVRPRIRELISGKLIDYDGQHFSPAGHCTFTIAGLPTVECANVSADINAESVLHRVSLDVPKAGWPEGSIWLMELEIRQDESSAWQLLSDELGGGFPIVLGIPPTAAPAGIKAMAYWWAFSHGLSGGLLPQNVVITPEIETSLCELISEVSGLLSRGYNDKAWQRLKVLERLFFELGRIAARRLEYSPTIACDLIQAAGRESISNPTRSLFVVIPELLTLPGEAYAGMPDTDGLRDSLRWCARTRSHPRVAEGFIDAIEQVIANPAGALPGVFAVLRNFENFAAVMQPPTNGKEPVDLGNFNFHRYRSQVIGPIAENHIAEAEWIDHSPFDKLCRNHALRALHALSQRRQSESGENGNQANAVFAYASELRSWLQTRFGRQSSFVSESTWRSPWLDVEFPDDALATNLNCYASMAALAARASAAGWLRFGEYLSWQSSRFGYENSIKASTTLIAMSPELFGYYLLMWELVIRTQPHD